MRGGSKAKAEPVVKRPFHALTSLGMLAHHVFELAVGVGLVYQPKLGLVGSAALWGGTIPTWSLAAARGSSRWDAPLAFLAGSSVGGTVLHFALWPWEVRRGLPLLTEAEGFKPEQLPAYNAVLYVWALAALLATLKETPRGTRKWAAAGFLAALTQRSSAQAHFVWVREQARTNPAWWNRAVVEKARDDE